MTDEKPKERKASAKQNMIVESMRAAHRTNGPGTTYTPAQVGTVCGKGGGSKASDWAYPAIKTLVRKGIILKGDRPGRYKLAGEA